MVTPHEEMLLRLFKKYEKESIPGTAYFEALANFAKVCFDTINEKGDTLTVGDLTSFIAAAYHIGFNRGYEAGMNFEQECNKLED